MKTLFDNLFVYESLLLIYFSEDKQVLNIFPNGTFHTIINRFLEILLNEDKQKGTNHIKLIQEIYSNPLFENRAEYFKKLNISNSTLQRYREKYSTTLRLVIEHFDIAINV